MRQDGLSVRLSPVFHAVDFSATPRITILRHSRAPQQIECRAREVMRSRKARSEGPAARGHAGAPRANLATVRDAG